MLADGGRRYASGFGANSPTGPEFLSYYSMSTWDDTYSAPSYDFHLGNRANIIFVDGHAEPLSKDEVHSRYIKKTFLFSPNNGANPNSDPW